ncbi:threonine/serine exporter family protein [Limosilactobacillus sp. RRLNB_1_1]|uniref:Threonine/serine exporter family protein n=1 Tax=Limosilactobacillus albertensis TaxID=2759752 RepID=A0A7W3TQX5_9LACO|nr:threonine/serine exporter family protein [Limosilactobacillus albertensis]MBB1069006.1 threonine/serine exporter family protein [Limosilactobacillus albertensis]MCD7118766.1 threonine/serine exporter family protein [Limosilactobacillus albertensis]MCD7128085.1 threonine/serine exporter family protein [Limosilactobacillus albertensis]
MLTKRRQALALKMCLLAGRLLIENGSNMERVNDTLSRMAKNAGLQGFQAFTTVTGIVVGTINEPHAQVITIRHRKNNLSKIADVNEVSRELARRKIDVPQAFAKLKKIDRQTSPKWQNWYESFAAAILSGALMIVFTGNIADSWAGFIAGGIGYGTFSYLLRKFKIQYLGEFCSSLIIGILAVLFVKFRLANNINDIIIGAVMPLVPGVPLTNAARDLVSGNLISGPTRGIEAILTAVSIGSAIVIVLHFN